jgi:hypothetical protein
MNDRLLRIESAVRDLERAIGTIEHRLAVIERAVAVTDAGDASLSPPPASPAPPAASLAAREALVTTLSFIGRTFVAPGGAYLLRALTDAAVIPLPLMRVCGGRHAVTFGVAGELILR